MTIHKESFNRTRAALLALSLVIFVLSPSPSQEKKGLGDKIEDKITESGFTRVGIAIPACKVEGQLSSQGEEITSTVTADLDFSGFFRPLDPALWSGTSVVEPPDFVSWQAMKADYLVLTSLTATQDQLVLEGKLYDVKNKEMVTGKRIKGPARDPRTLGHNLSAVILDYLFGAGRFPISQVLFTSQVGNTQDIFIADYDGRGILRLTAMGLLNVTPHINPKGDRIVFTSILKDRHELFLLDRTGRRVKLYGQGEGLNTSPKFSPDAGTVAFCSSKSGNPDIWSIGIDGKGLKRLTNSWAIDTAPAWSPDGKEIAFTSDRSGSPQIYIMSRDGSNQRRFTPEGVGRSDQACWSPRGDKIAYASSVKGRFDIMVQNISTGEVTNLTQNGGDDESPSWSPDGRYLAFASNRGGSYQRSIIRADAVGATDRTKKPNCNSPCWF